MNSDAFDCYQDAIMLVEEARIIARKMENDLDDDNKDNENNVESIRIARSLYLRALSIQEALTGWCNEDTARIYYELGWFEYDQAMNYDHALTYLLQALRISNQLYDDGSGKNDDDCHHPVTMAILDDIQDLLEDMDLDDLGEEYVNKVFESWELQDEAEDIVMGRNQDDTRDDPTPHDYRGPSPALILYQKALRRLPQSSSFGVELERAYVYSQMAVLAGAQHEWEDALSYYCSALIRLPNWLREDHPTIRKIKKESILLAQQRLTPVCCGNNNHDACRQQMTVMLSIPSLEQLPQVEQDIPESLDQLSHSSTIQTSPSLWLKSYPFPIKAANE